MMITSLLKLKQECLSPVEFLISSLKQTSSLQQITKVSKLLNISASQDLHSFLIWQKNLQN